LGRRIAGGRGHYSLVGTPTQIADHLQAWFEQGAADGFNVLVPHLPGGSKTSPMAWSRNCSGVGCSEPSMRAGPCARTWAWPDRKTDLCKHPVVRIYPDPKSVFKFAIFWDASFLPSPQS
jgi:hypothetical protein